MKFRRNTHDENGEFRIVAMMAQNSREIMKGVAGTLIHMLHPREARTLDSICIEIAEYDAAFPDTAPCCGDIKDILRALAGLIYTTAVVVEE